MYHSTPRFVVLAIVSHIVPFALSRCSTFSQTRKHDSFSILLLDGAPVLVHQLFLQIDLCQDGAELG